MDTGNPVGRPFKSFMQKENPITVRFSREFIEAIKAKAKDEGMGWQSWLKSTIAKELKYPDLWRK